MARLGDRDRNAVEKHDFVLLRNWQLLFSLAPLMWHAFPKSEISSFSRFWNSKRHVHPLAGFPFLLMKISFSARLWGGMLQSLDLNENWNPWVSGGLLVKLWLTCPFPFLTDLTPTSQDVPGSPQPLFRWLGVCRAEKQVCSAGNQRNPNGAGTLCVRTEQPSVEPPKEAGFWSRAIHVRLCSLHTVLRLPATTESEDWNSGPEVLFSSASDISK